MARSARTRRHAKSTKKHHIKKKQEKKSPPTNKSLVQMLYDMVQEQEKIHFDLYKRSKFKNRMIGDDFVVYLDLSKEVEHAIQSHTDIETLRREVLEEKTKRINNPGDYMCVTSYVRAATWFSDACDVLLM
jgi:rubrerythrin